jgi:hypothetical protein
LLVGDVERETGGRVSESADAEHAAYVDELVEARDPAQRHDGKRRHQEQERPIAGAMDDVIERPRAEPDREPVVAGDQDREEPLT